MATLILASLQSGFNIIALEGKVLLVTLYLIILPIFCFVPFGYDIEPDASQEQRGKAYFLRILLNVMLITATIGFWNAHTDIEASIFKNPESVIKEMEESDLVMKIVFLLMSHFILFTACRACVILLRWAYQSFRVSIRIV